MRPGGPRAGRGRPGPLPWLLVIWHGWILLAWFQRYPVGVAGWIEAFDRFVLDRRFSLLTFVENWTTFLAAAGALLGALAVIRRTGEIVARPATRGGCAGTDPLIAHATGLGALGLLTLGAGLCGLIAAVPAPWGSVILALAGAADLAARPAAWRRLARELDPRDALRPLGPVARAATALLAGVTFAHILGIETGWDAMTYHLRFPSFYLLHHKVFDLWHQLAGSFPQHGEMVWLAARGWGGDTLARFLNVAIGLLALAAARRVAVRLGTAPGLPAAVVLLAPMTALLLTRCYLDLLTLLWGGCAWLGLLAWRARDRPAGALAAGLAAGLAMSTKYTGVMLVPALLAAAWPPPSFRRRRRELWWATAAAALVLGPWLLRNEFHRGDPVAPFFSSRLGLPQELNGDFQLPLEHTASVSRVLASTAGARIEALLFNDGRMQGPLGPAFAALLPWLCVAAPALERGAAVILGAALRGTVVFLATWLVLAPDARFLTPVLPLACALLARLATPALAARRGPGRWHRPLLEAGFVLAALYAAGYQWAIDAPLSMPLGLESRQDKLELGLRPAPFLAYTAAYINERIPPGDRVLLASHFTSYYIERECLNDVHFGRARVARFIREGRTVAGVARVFRQRGIRWVLGCGDLAAGFAHIPGFYDAGPGGWESWKRFLATRGEAVWMTTGFTLFRLGPPHAPRPLPALPPLDGAVPGDPLVADTGAAAARQAAGLDARGDFSSAARAWEQALARGLDTPAVQFGLARACIMLDRPGEAAPHVLRALLVHPRSAYGRALLAVILAAAGDRAGARVAITAAVGLEPADPEYRRLAREFGALP